MNNSYYFMEHWLAIEGIQNKIKKELEDILQKEHNLSLKGFYVLYYLSKAPNQKLRLQELQEMVDVSQSALSRIVSHMESTNCGALEKKACSTDRRGTYTHLTKAGNRKLQKSLATFHDILKPHLSSNNIEKLMSELIGML